MCRVVHCKVEKYDVYIGRVRSKPNKMHYGNPFTHKEGTLAGIVLESREQAIDVYEKWLLKQDYLDLQPQRRDWILANMHLLKGKILGCWCKPLSCHGDILIKLIDKL